MSTQVEEMRRPPFIWTPVSAAIEACPYRDRDEWLAIRRTGIGSSDAAAAAGVSEHEDKTDFALYENKVGIAPDIDLSDSEAVYIGTKLEPFVAEMFSDRTGLQLRRSNRVLRRRDLPFMLANLDREIVGAPEILEIKTVGFTSHGFVSPAWGEDGTDQVPIDVRLQVQHQHAVRGSRMCYVAAFIAGVGLHVHPIERDDELIDTLVQLEARFWRRVEEKNPPPPTSFEDVKRRFPRQTMPSKAADEPTAEAALRYAELSGLKSRAEKEIEDLKGQIGAFLGEAEALLVGGKTFVTFKTQTRKAYSVAESTTRVMRVVKENAS
ncbi:MAG: lambda-exonuclease family protein [Vulcanimicrobiaceae bacterium]|jgi:putative phage-type endonuclease